MWNRKSTPAAGMALGGVFAALSLVIMGLGGMIPVATYVCPVMIMVLLQIVLKLCGSRIAWAWYGAVAILSLLISPDKEAAAVFVFIGYYPILKPRMDKSHFPVLLKLVFFNAAMVLLYWILLNIMGMADLQQEFSQMGGVLIAMLLILGNLTFFLLDRILGRQFRRRHRDGR